MKTDTEQRFEHMLQQSQPALVRLARRYAGREDWQDLLQDMQLQLWRSFASFDGRAQLTTWVYRVALNTALGHVRKPRREHATLDAMAEPGDGGHVGDPMVMLEEFLASLDPVSRGVLLLDLEGLSRAQAADVLGISENAAAIRMTRLRKAFESRYLEDAP